MSKCKAVLDGDKITKIQVKMKGKKNQRKNSSESKDDDTSQKISQTKQESE